MSRSEELTSWIVCYSSECHLTITGPDNSSSSNLGEGGGSSKQKRKKFRCLCVFVCVFLRKNWISLTTQWSSTLELWSQDRWKSDSSWLFARFTNRWDSFHLFPYFCFKERKSPPYRQFWSCVIIFRSSLVAWFNSLQMASSCEGGGPEPPDYFSLSRFLCGLARTCLEWKDHGLHLARSFRLCLNSSSPPFSQLFTDSISSNYLIYFIQYSSLSLTSSSRRLVVKVPVLSPSQILSYLSHSATPSCLGQSASLFLECQIGHSTSWNRVTRSDETEEFVFDFEKNQKCVAESWLRLCCGSLKPSWSIPNYIPRSCGVLMLTDRHIALRKYIQLIKRSSYSGTPLVVLTICWKSLVVMC